MSVFYSVCPTHPENHLFDVTCRISGGSKQAQLVSLPAWIPGSYMLRDFAKNIVRFSVSANSKPLAHHKVDKDTWSIDASEHDIEIVYQVYALDLSVRSAHLDNTHAFFNGTSVFLRVHGREQEACSVKIEAPVAEQYKSWKIATSMQSEQNPLKGLSDTCQFGDYKADNYADLIEHPVEMGDFDWLAFEACGVPHYIALTGRHEADQERLKSDLKIICEHHIKFFGEPAPIDRYVFLVMITGDGYGGLEHTYSTALLCSRKDLPAQADPKTHADYRRFLGLCSHEYFHTWNVKRIRPAEFINFDLQRENYTHQLWAYEGITSYYDDLALVRTGLISYENYFELLSGTLNNLDKSRGRLVQNLHESSFEAWTKFYKQDENAVNAIVSYYTKGAVVAILLDLLLRKIGLFTLDDLMRELWKECRESAANYQGTSEKHIYNTIISLFEKHSNQLEISELKQELKEFFESALYEIEELPVAESLAEMGLLLASHTDNQKNGTAKAMKTRFTASLGVRLKADSVTGSNFPKVTHTYNNSAAEKAGLSPGDTIIALNGIKAQMANFEKQISQLPVSQKIEIQAFRRDELMTFEATLQETVLQELKVINKEANNDLIENWLS